MKTTLNQVQIILLTNLLTLTSPLLSDLDYYPEIIWLILATKIGKMNNWPFQILLYVYME